MTSLRLHSSRCVLGRRPEELRMEPARVLIEDGLITEVHPGDPVAGDELLGEQILAPAFVNAHTHLALHACRGLTAPQHLRGNLVEDLFFRVEAELEPEDVEAFARVAALECLLHGVGTVFDHYYHGLATARAVRDCGLAAVIAPTLQDLSGPGAHLAESALAQSVELDTGPWRAAGVVAAVGPHATDTVSARLWGQALDLAQERGLLVHAHVAQSAQEAQRCLSAHGCSPVAWLEREGFLERPVRQLLVHALFVSAADLRRLDPHHQVLGANPFSQTQFGFPAAVEDWDAAGLDWVVGTDCGASNDSMDVQKELRLLATQTSWSVTHSLEHAALVRQLDATTVQALESRRQSAADRAPSDPRKLLHRVWAAPERLVGQMNFGVIEAGARAQLLVLDPEDPALWPGTDPWRGLAFSSLTSAIRSVIAGGQWLGRPGHPRACLEEPQVRAWIDEASRRHAGLLRRAAIAG